MSKFKVGDTVTLTQDSMCYTGRYAGERVNIKKMDTEYFFTVQAADGKIFACPVKYIVDPTQVYVPSVPKCECGAIHTSFPSFHSDYCPLYKERK